MVDFNADFIQNFSHLYMYFVPAYSTLFETMKLYISEVNQISKIWMDFFWTISDLNIKEKNTKGSGAFQENMVPRM